MTTPARTEPRVSPERVEKMLSQEAGIRARNDNGERLCDALLDLRDARQQITTLQQELREAREIADERGVTSAMLDERVQTLTSERDTAQAQVGVLREALLGAIQHADPCDCPDNDLNDGGRSCPLYIAERALSSTTQAAEEHTARVAELQSVIDWMDEQIRIKNISWVGVPYDIATNGAIAREAVAKRQEEHAARVRREALREAVAKIQTLDERCHPIYHQALADSAMLIRTLAAASETGEG